jgi:hypothetical protein
MFMIIAVFLLLVIACAVCSGFKKFVAITGICLGVGLIALSIWGYFWGPIGR